MFKISELSSVFHKHHIKQVFRYHMHSDQIKLAVIGVTSDIEDLRHYFAGTNIVITNMEDLKERTPNMISIYHE